MAGPIYENAVPDRPAAYAAVYRDALNEVLAAVARMHAELGEPERGNPLLDTTARLLDPHLHAHTFSVGLRQEQKQVRATLHDFAYTMMAVGDLLNNGCRELAQDYDPAVQKAKIRAQLKPWQRWIPFYAAFLAHRQIRRYLNRTPLESAGRMQALFTAHLAERRRKRRYRCFQIRLED